MKIGFKHIVLAPALFGQPDPGAARGLLGTEFCQPAIVRSAAGELVFVALR